MTRINWFTWNTDVAVVPCESVLANAIILAETCVFNTISEILAWTPATCQKFTTVLARVASWTIAVVPGHVEMVLASRSVLTRFDETRDVDVAIVSSES